MLAYCVPLAMWRLWRGYALVNESRNESDSTGVAAPRFTIRDVLLATAIVGVAAGIGRWGLTSHSDALSAHVGYVLLDHAVRSLIFVIPIVWASLVVRSTRRSLSWLGLLTVVFFAFHWIVSSRFFSGPGAYGLLIASVSGTALTVPAALFLWRWCGWRLVGPSCYEPDDG